MKRTLLTIFTLTAMALPLFAGEVVINDITWEYDGDSSGVVFTRCRPVNSGVVIPSELNGCPVTAVANNAFLSSRVLATVVVPEGVTNIGCKAFSSCHYLSAVKLPPTLKNLSRSVFSSCWKLDSILIPNNVTNIGENAFSDCWRLQSVIMPANLVSIGSGAFKDCSSLTEIMIPIHIADIGNGAFAGCKKLSLVRVAKFEIDKVKKTSCRQRTQYRQNQNRRSRLVNISYVIKTITNSKWKQASKNVWLGYLSSMEQEKSISGRR